MFLTYIHPLFLTVFLGHSGKLSDTNLKPGNNPDLACRCLVLLPLLTSWTANSVY